MEFIWGGIREKVNTRLVFSLNLKENCDRVDICAVDGYQVFLDGNFVAYGPERTAEGYSRKKKVDIKGCKKLEIKVISYNMDTYACDRQLPFFGAEIYNGEKVVYKSSDFSCYEELSRCENTSRYSRQRGYVEKYDFTVVGVKPIETYEVDSPVILEGIGELCNYDKVEFNKLSEGEFSGFDEIIPPWWEQSEGFKPKEGSWEFRKNFIGVVKEGYFATDYKLSHERTGFIKLIIEADEKTDIFAVWDEYLPDGKWIYGRSACIDLISISVPKGKTEIISAEPYALQYLKILQNGKAKITPSVIVYENCTIANFKPTGNENLDKVLWAAQNSFRQNAVDIFTDCPGRERAGWLCDSYFTAKAEKLFTGENKIEKAFLENIIIATNKEIDSRMLPMCFPSQHEKDSFIPNWAMWFVVEMKDYLDRTGDRGLVDKARDKIYGVVDYFKDFENEYGLLEDLKSWIFVEWSICNSYDYVRGVNFPSNMLYACMLEAVYYLYGDENAKKRAKEIKAKIVEISYDGKFFADNAERVDGKICRIDSHVSETCQYYALFCGICPDKEYAERIKLEFGPFRKQGCYSEIERSNAFIGNYLRFFWLDQLGEYERIKDECLEYFLSMAQKTGTLWEHDSPKASCNHGFASAAAYLLRNEIK